jgi:hypothetical protein
MILFHRYPTIERLRWALKLRVDYLVLKPAEVDELTGVLQRRWSVEYSLDNRESAQLGGTRGTLFQAAAVDLIYTF